MHLSYLVHLTYVIKHVAQFLFLERINISSTSFLSYSYLSRHLFVNENFLRYFNRQRINLLKFTILFSNKIFISSWRKLKVLKSELLRNAFILSVNVSPFYVINVETNTIILINIALISACPFLQPIFRQIFYFNWNE